MQNPSKEGHMPSLLSSDVIKLVRARKRMTRMAIQDVMSFNGIEENDILSQITILRAEKGYQNLKVENAVNLMGILEVPVDTSFCPSMENQTMELLQMYEELTYYTAHAKENAAFCQKAQLLLGDMKTNKNFAQGINRQLIISKEIVILDALEKDPATIMELIREGLDITFLELTNNLPDIRDALIFEEAPLLHNLAGIYMREGDSTRAISLLTSILTGLKLLSQDDRDKERMYAPILLTLAECYMKEKNYDEVLNVCDAGHKIALKRNNGFHVPDFTRLKIYCLNMLGENDELPVLITQTIAGYLLLRRHSKADSLLQFAEEYNITINTHDMETVRQPLPQPNFTYGKTVSCNNIGDLIAGLRFEEGLTLECLSEGLCAFSTLNKIESKSYPLDRVYLLEAIMQRLGRYIDHYFSTFPTREDFKNKQMRDEVNTLLVTRKYREAEKLLETLAAQKSFTDSHSINKQFIEKARASIYCGTIGYDTKHMEMLHNALNITRKKEFDIKQVANTRLTYYDITIINQMANNLCLNGQMREGLRLFEDLIESMDRYYVDEREKARTYTMVLDNYAIFLWRTKRYEESLEVATTADELDAKYRGLRTLPGISSNIACSMLSLGDKKNCRPYFALAYYGSMLVGRQDNVDAIASHVKEQIGIEFYSSLSAPGVVTPNGVMS